MTLPGSKDTPLRVAIIGAGPAGFYTADHLLKQKNLSLEIDIFDRLPTPYGLVRAGVAPDHQKIKSVTKVYDKIAAHPNVRAWYNGHPDFTDYQFDLSQEQAVVIGIGNVAMDVARILCRTPEELQKTDMAARPRKK